MSFSGLPTPVRAWENVSRMRVPGLDYTDLQAVRAHKVASKQLRATAASEYATENLDLLDALDDLLAPPVNPAERREQVEAVFSMLVSCMNISATTKSQSLVWYAEAVRTSDYGEGMPDCLVDARATVERLVKYGALKRLDDHYVPVPTSHARRSSAPLCEPSKPRFGFKRASLDLTPSPESAPLVGRNGSLSATPAS